MILPKWWTSWTPRTKRISPLNFCSISTFLVLMRIIHTYLSNRSCKVAYPPSTNYVTFSFSSNQIPLYASTCHIRKQSLPLKKKTSTSILEGAVYTLLYIREIHTFPRLVYPASCRYCGIWVVFPEPVSPTITRTCNQHPIFIKCKHSKLSGKGIITSLRPTKKSKNICKQPINLTWWSLIAWSKSSL